MNPEEFRAQFLNDVHIHAASCELHTEIAFLEYSADLLVEAEELSHFEPCCFRGTGPRGKQLQLDGYAIVDEDATVSLLAIDFRDIDQPVTLTRSDADTTFGRLVSFIQLSVSGRLIDEIEPSAPAYGFVTDLRTRWKSFAKARLYLLTDAKISGRLQEYADQEVDGLRCEFHIWDMSRFQRIAESSRGREEVVVDFAAMTGHGIPCIAAHLGDSQYESYLCVVPGAVLADIYDKYGQRLLEQNVRTFLQYAGGVNKGMRNTIVNDPGMFFAYNNGVTVTATEVTKQKTKSGGMEISNMRDMQIVNGGQTTASLFWARKSHGASLENVFVQVKLSVIPPDKAEIVVPNISRYANSQNKVSEADFFSNHPFHQRLQDLSRRLLAPATGGQQFQTRWYYERVRGQYRNELAALSGAAKKAFEKQNPKKQVFTKTDLAKFENTWGLQPHIVSLGAQKNFARFAKQIAELWDSDSTTFNEHYYRQIVTHVIVFRETEHIVSSQSWYTGGYRAQIVTYALARLSFYLAHIGKSLDLESIWKDQAISDVVKAQIAKVARAAYDVLTSPPQGISNVTEWAKKEACWSRLKEADISLDYNFADELVSLRDLRINTKEAKKVQVMDDGIQAQIMVMEKGAEYWVNMKKWGQQNGLLTPTELSFITVAASGRTPSEKQSVRLAEIEAKARTEGFT